MEEEYLLFFISKPAKQNVEQNDYHFKIPRKFIRMGIIDPEQNYKINLTILKENNEE